MEINGIAQQEGLLLLFKELKKRKQVIHEGKFMMDIGEVKGNILGLLNESNDQMISKHFEDLLGIMFVAGVLAERKKKVDIKFTRNDFNKNQAERSSMYG